MSNAADDLPTLLAQRDALFRAIGSGELVIQTEGKRVEYRSMGDLEKALKLIENQISSVNGTVRRRVVFQDSPNSKGWFGTRRIIGP